MKRIKKQRLELAGWVVGDSAQFLQLSVEENRFIELKSRAAKMEAADRSVSFDLVMRSLLN